MQGHGEKESLKMIDTQVEAVNKIDKNRLQAGVIAALRECGELTAEEIAIWMNHHGYPIGCDRQDIQPRCTELERVGKIEKTKNRRMNRKSALFNRTYVLGGEM